ncbi:hypothetical protein VKT23_012393 [Stygiomarasmius scandens]|uniref:Uncharacterized protein n=1 Tax=Marasmiellus scandens TaxID=2682957 RepID=A0ABR1J8J8_9AGAR
MSSQTRQTHPLTLDDILWIRNSTLLNNAAVFFFYGAEIALSLATMYFVCGLPKSMERRTLFAFTLFILFVATALCVLQMELKVGVTVLVNFALETANVFKDSFNPRDLKFMMTIPLLATYLLAVIQMGYKTLCHHKDISKNLSLSNNIVVKGQKIFCLFVESGLAYCILWIAYTIVIVRTSPNDEIPLATWIFQLSTPLISMINATLIMLMTVLDRLRHEIRDAPPLPQSVGFTSTQIRSPIAEQQMSSLPIHLQIEPYNLRYEQQSSDPDVLSANSQPNLPHITPYNLKYQPIIPETTLEGMPRHSNPHTGTSSGPSVRSNVSVVPGSYPIQANSTPTTRQIQLQEEADDLREQVQAILSAVNNSNEGMQVAMAGMMAHIRSLESQINSESARGLVNEPPPVYY